MAAFDPYHKWLAIPPHEQPPHHYRLLGVVPFEDDADVVDAAAEQRMAYLRTCATGEFVALSQRLLNEVASARLCLLNPQKKAEYDAELRRRLAAAPAKAPVPSGAPASRSAAMSSAAPDARSDADPLDEFDDLDEFDAFEQAVRRPQRRTSGDPKAGNRRKGDAWRPTPTMLAIGIGGGVGVFVMLVVVIAYVAGRGTARPEGASPDESGALVQIDVRANRPGSTNSTSTPVFGTRPGPGLQTPSPPRGTEPPQPPSQTSPTSTTGPAPRSAVAPFDAAQARTHQLAWAQHLGETVVIANSIGMQLVLIPPGEFLAGPESARKRVVLTRPFRIGRFEVTRAEWRTAMRSEPWGPGTARGTGTDLPVSHVTWNDAVAFCQTLTESERAAGRLPADHAYRLPTEAEWEYACRAGTTTSFSFGEDPSLMADHAWYKRNTSDAGSPQPGAVGRKLPNPWGLHDMYGNVREWCGDFADVQRPSGTDPTGPATGSYRVCRGGSWRTVDPAFLKSHDRTAVPPGLAASENGFRVVLSIVANPATGRLPPGVSAVPTPPSVAPPPVVPPSRVGPAPPRAVAPFDAAQAKAHQEAWAKHLGEPVETTNSIGMKFVLIPPGQFTLGSPSDERGRHAESEAPFHITMPAPMRVGLHEVPRKQWRYVVGSVPVSGPPAAGDAADDLPVTGITWSEAVVFCSRLTDTERTAGRLSSKSSYRLPSGSEWEIACRAGTTTAYSFGSDESRLPEHAWFASNTVEDGTRAPRPVGRKRPNDWGLFDMHGNVAEWCLDRGDRRIAGPPNGTSCVVRGGGFLGTESSLRSAAYVLQPMNGPRIDLGLRVLLTIDPSSTGAAPPNVSAPPPAAPNPVAPPARVGPAPPPAVAPFDAAQAKAHQEAWAKHLGQPVEATNSIGMRLVVIPPGKFTVGIGPARVEVTLTRPYRIGRHEVTQGQWQDVMPPPRSQRVGIAALKGRNYPMFLVTHEAIADFCRRLTERERASGLLSEEEEYRLPTEAEWDRAAQAGTTTRFWFGDDDALLPDHAWCKDNTPTDDPYPHEVGLKLPNPWGCSTSTATWPSGVPTPGPVRREVWTRIASEPIRSTHIGAGAGILPVKHAACGRGWVVAPKRVPPASASSARSPSRDA